MRIVLKQFSDIAPLAAPRKPNPVAPGEAGLTLIEMLVVLVIIAVIAGMVVMNVMSRPDQAKATTAQSDLSTIGTALATYRLNNGAYPTTEQGLKALAEKTNIPPLPTSFPDGGYVSTPPQDPWGRPYLYQSNGSTYEIRTLGRDGKPGGEGVDADIVKKR